MNRYICIHGHFYQPPRENPWLEEVELQDSAYPYHDWNERITAECYEPNANSRILDPEGRIIDLVNNYVKISFNIGPTLLSWMERHKPDVYKSILKADKLSMERFSGHGSALAQVYNHIIMPLANNRDKATQVIWGIKDFEYHFGRKPEGMWLAETAVDLETLDVLSENGIKFTILAPRQAKGVRKIGEDEWHDVSGEKIDTKMPYICNLPSGRTISIFFYDGYISQDIAFGNLLNNGEVFAKRILDTFATNGDIPQIAHIATDGETYGHHHRLGDMALAYCLYFIESNNLAKITIYGEYIEKHPPEYEVEIMENSSWSCLHGVERWKSNCGCNSGMHPDWSQEWRAHLRGAMDWLRDTLVHIYEEEMSKYVNSPWQARDEYINVILARSEINIEIFFTKYCKVKLSNKEKARVFKLIEMQHNSMLMYTSCGWFFDEISGIETVQVMQYAACAMQLLKEISDVALESAYISILERAPSNIPKIDNGAQAYVKYVKPAVIDLLRVGAHFAVSSLFEDYPETTKIYCYTNKREDYDLAEAGRQKLAIGKVSVKSDITQEEITISFAVLSFGDHNINGGVRGFVEEQHYNTMHQEIKEAFMKSDIPEVIRLMESNFSTHNYSLWHLFRDEQRKVVNQIFETGLKEMDALFRQIYEHNYPIMLAMDEMNIPIPKYLASTVEFVLNIDIRRLLEEEEIDVEQLKKLAGEIKRWSFEVDRRMLNFIVSRKLNNLMEKFMETPEDVSILGNLDATLEIADALSLELDLWRAQNIFFLIGRDLRQKMLEKGETGDSSAKIWSTFLNSLGRYLHVRST